MDVALPRSPFFILFRFSLREEGGRGKGERRERKEEKEGGERRGGKREKGGQGRRQRGEESVRSKANTAHSCVWGGIFSRGRSTLCPLGIHRVQEGGCDLTLPPSLFQLLETESYHIHTPTWDCTHYQTMNNNIEFLITFDK